MHTNSSQILQNNGLKRGQENIVLFPNSAFSGNERFSSVDRMQTSLFSLVMASRWPISSHRRLDGLLVRKIRPEWTGDDHRRVRGALVSFLKPETLRGALFGKMDKEVAKLLEMHWRGNRKIAIFYKLFDMQMFIFYFVYDLICAFFFFFSDKHIGNAFNEEPHIQHNELTNIWNGARSN